MLMNAHMHAHSHMNAHIWRPCSPRQRMRPSVHTSSPISRSAAVSVGMICFPSNKNDNVSGAVAWRASHTFRNVCMREHTHAGHMHACRHTFMCLHMHNTHACKVTPTRDKLQQDRKTVHAEKGPAEKKTTIYIGKWSRHNQHFLA